MSAYLLTRAWSHLCAVRGSDLKDLADAGRLPIALAIKRAPGGWAELYVPDRLRDALLTLAAERRQGADGRGTTLSEPHLTTLRRAQETGLDTAGLLVVLQTPGAMAALLELQAQRRASRKRR